LIVDAVCIVLTMCWRTKTVCLALLHHRFPSRGMQNWMGYSLNSYMY